MPGNRKKSKDPGGSIEVQNISIFNRNKVKEKKRLSIKERNAIYNYRYDKNYNYAGFSGSYEGEDTIKVENSSSWKLSQVHKDQYDADNSSSITSIFSCTYAHRSPPVISLGRKLKPVYLRKQRSVLKLSRFYHHAPVVAVPCRNICYNSMKMRQQSGANLKQMFYTEIQREKRKERHRKKIPQQNFQVLVVTPTSSEVENDDTIGTPATEVPQGNVRQNRQNKELHKKNFPELLIITPTTSEVPKSDTINTHCSEFPKMDDGPEQQASKTSPGSGDQSVQAKFTVDSEMQRQMRSVSFLICALFTVILGRFMDVLFPILPHGEMILWILASVILLNWEIDSNIGEYFERFYQFVIGLIGCLCWWF
ncbi:uncharacterized protein LOC111518560 [Drosophila willistoni]|uniref:uncharacterized protein LOC111518560 n=1 Tax=Drosophila willistoni TaxID=7260 RepID=UPI000C26C689|nr:uncharacterized protein LOC111518560 [Drosophila willistoni]